ncbi:uncharacterized protein TM35_000301790, partial [Trypanosoma theileri]
MTGKELHPYYSHLNEQGSPLGLTSGALNFFLATADTNTQKAMERAAYWNSFTQQSTSAPVYGPSKPPRLQQFVDLASNVCSMTPFFSLGGDVAVGEQGNGQETLKEKQEELEIINTGNTVYMGPVFHTPQQQKERLPVTLITPTPTSTMGMTISPATACRDIHQITPAQTVMCGTCVSTHTTTITSNNNNNNNNTIHVEMRSRPQLQKINTTPAVVVHSSCLASELESAFQEHRIRKNTREVSNHVIMEGKEEKEMEEEEINPNNNNNNNNNTNSNMEEEEEEEENEEERTDNMMATGKPSDDNSAESKRRSNLARREERAAQRRNKEQRQGKSKNNNGHQKQNKNSSNNNSNNNNTTSRSPLVSLTNGDNAWSMGDGKKYMLSLLCHGERKVTVVSFMELHTGDHVLFEGDRGVDLGEVIGCEESVNESPGVNNNN